MNATYLGVLTNVKSNCSNIYRAYVNYSDFI
jgi:hypothetical protein